MKILIGINCRLFQELIIQALSQLSEKPKFVRYDPQWDSYFIQTLLNKPDCVVIEVENNINLTVLKSTIKGCQQQGIKVKFIVLYSDYRVVDPVYSKLDSSIILINENISLPNFLAIFQ